MSEASGLYKKVKVKKEVTFALKPVAAGSRALRRITSDLSLTKDTYRSAEIRPEMQVKDFRHGVRRVTGKLSADLSAGTFSDFIGSFCKRLFTAGVTSGAASITIVADGANWKLTRAAGDWLADGFKVGMVVRASGGALDPANVAKNLWVLDVDANDLWVAVVNGSGMVAEGPIAAVTVACPGKTTWMPTAGHIEESYSIEHFFAETPASEVFIGCKVNGVTLNLPPTGMATVDIDILGKTVDVADVEYFTAPTAATTTDSMAAVNGLLRADGGLQAVLTGLTINGVANYTGDPVVGSNSIPKFFPGMLEVSGQATAYFDTVELRDAFLDETEIDIAAVFTGDNDADAQFMAFVMPRVKVNSHTKSDGEGAIIATIEFMALLNSAGGAGIKTEATTLLVQDSDAF